MHLPHFLIRPSILVPGYQYLLQYPAGTLAAQTSRPVTLIRATVCPAIVIVEDILQRRFPCDRLWLYELPGERRSRIRRAASRPEIIAQGIPVPGRVLAPAKNKLEY